MDDGDGQQTFSLAHLTSTGVVVAFALKNVATAALSCLAVFPRVWPARLAIVGVDAKVARLVERVRRMKFRADDSLAAW